MATPIKNANSARPSALGQPVPGKEAALTADEILASFDAPAAAAPSSADALVSEIAGEEAPVAAPEDQFAPEPGFAEANVDQFQNFATRVQAGLAANDVEKLGFLRKKFGAENAVIKGDKLYFRRSASEKFKPLDPDTLELINDIIPDFAREIVTEAAMLPGEIGGTLAAGPAGTVLGRAGSVPLANEFANRVASLAGVPQDESRSGRTENVVGMAAETFLPVIGKQIMKRLPGTLAYQEAKKAGEREIVALSKQSQEVASAVELLAQEGRAASIKGDIVGIPNANVSLMGHHLNPDNPTLQKIANISAADPRFINAQTQLAEDWGSSLRNTFIEIARRNNKGPVDPNRLASSVTNAVADLQKAEGQAIGAYRAKAMAQIGNKKIPLPPEIGQQAQGLMQEMGFKMQARGESVSIVPPKDLRPLVGKMGLTSIGEVRTFVNNLNDVAQGMKSGVSVMELDRLRNSIGTASDSLYRTPAGAALGRMSGDLRKSYRDVISSGLADETEKRGFNQAMDDFGQLKLNVATLKNALNEDASAKAIVRSIFTGRENLEKVRAIKQLSPESFGALKEEWINQTLEEYASRESKTGFKSSQFLDALNKKYGKQFAEEVLNDGPGPNFDTVKKILTVTERIENQFKTTNVDAMSEAQKKGIMDAAIGVIADIKFKQVNGLSAIFSSAKGRDNALIQIMTRDGIDKYVAAYPGRGIDKATVSQQLHEILAHNKVYKMIGESGKRVIRREAVDAAIDTSGRENTPPQ